MQCMMQVFDSDGKPQLHGGGKLKDHIDWLPLLGLPPRTRVNPRTIALAPAQAVCHRLRSSGSSSVPIIQLWRLSPARLPIRAT